MQDFGAGARFQAVPGIGIDAVGDEANRAIGREQVDAAGVLAACGSPAIGARDAIRFRRIGQPVVVVKSAVYIAIRPLGVAVGFPIRRLADRFTHGGGWGDRGVEHLPEWGTGGQRTGGSIVARPQQRFRHEGGVGGSIHDIAEAGLRRGVENPIARVVRAAVEKAAAIARQVVVRAKGGIGRLLRITGTQEKSDCLPYAGDVRWGDGEIGIDIEGDIQVEGMIQVVLFDIGCYFGEGLPAK